MNDQLAVDEFGPISCNDAVRMLLGRKIGAGQFRDVYISALHPRHVIKWEFGVTTRWCNIIEHTIWENLSDTTIGKWLAPVHAISQNGIWLLMSRCDPMGEADRPDKVPAFFCDLKPSNWGLFKGRPVCLDYGNNGLLTGNALQRKLVKARWRTE